MVKLKIAPASSPGQPGLTPKGQHQQPHRPNHLLLESVGTCRVRVRGREGAALVTSALVNSGHAGAGGGRRSDDNDTDKITTGPSYPGTRYTFQKLEQKTSNLY